MKIKIIKNKNQLLKSKYLYNTNEILLDSENILLVEF